MLEEKIESVLFFKNEPVSVGELSKLLNATSEQIKYAVKNLQDFYKKRGIVIVTDGDLITFGTNPELSLLIETLEKEEFSRELSHAALETLSIILYRAPVSRREIDQIRGVNSSYTLRALLIRGLIERTGEGYAYKPTLKLLEHLGVAKREELPEFGSAFSKIEEFIKHENNGRQ